MEHLKNHLNSSGLQLRSWDDPVYYYRVRMGFQHNKTIRTRQNTCYSGTVTGDTKRGKMSGIAIGFGF